MHNSSIEHNLADIGLAILLLWHIGSVVMWLGSSATFAFGVAPTLLRSSIEQRQSFLHSFFPRFSGLVGVSSISTVVAGTILFGYVSSIDTAIMPVGWRFIFISIGAVLGLVAIIMTLGIVLPLGNKLSVERSQREDSFANDPLKRYKYSDLDDESMFKAMSSSMRGTTIILVVVMTLMVLGAAL